MGTEQINLTATDQNSGNMKKSDLRRLFSLIIPHRWHLIAAMCSMGLAAASTAVMAWLIRPLLDQVFTEGNVSLLNSMTILTLGVYSCTGIFSFLQSYLMNRIGFTIVNDLRVKLYSHIQRQSLYFFHRNPSGELISRVVNDVSLIQGSVTQVVTSLVMDLCTVLGLITVLVLQDWLLAILGLLVLPAALYPIIRFGRRLRKLATTGQLIMGRLISVLTETFQGVRMIQSYNMTDHEIDRFSRECRENVDNIMRAVTVKSLSSSIMEILGGICLAAVIWYGGYSVLRGKSTPGTFFSFMAALLLIYEPLKRLTRIHNEIQQGLSAARRIFDVLDCEPRVKTPQNPCPLANNRSQGLIEFKDVSFAYEPGRPALSNINLTVKPGEMLALVGHSGGGKTSLVNLLPRFYDPDSGQILLDGQDVSTIDLTELRQQIALVSQDVVLFETSILNNIAYGRPSASNEEIHSAARAALADGFIEELPFGYDENIGEHGHKLSGGQRQRLAIARAIIKDAPILILDEATSALDTESEKFVQTALENLMRHRTTLVIAHRLSTIVKADRIVVLREGRIVEEGPHEALLESKGEYFKLYQMQFIQETGGSQQ